MATKIRARLAQLLWLVCALAALLLAVGALLVALDANQKNDLVDFVLRAADYVDLGVFSREDGIKQFRGAGGRRQERAVQLGSRRDRLAGRGPHPGPDREALTRSRSPP